MIHYLLLKMKAGHMNEELFLLTCSTFRQLQNELDCVREARVYRSCVIRGSNADLLIEMDLTGQEALEIYLEHPLHKAFASATQPHLRQRITFDRL